MDKEIIIINPKFGLSKAWILLGEENKIDRVIAVKNKKIKLSKSRFCQEIFFDKTKFNIDSDKINNPPKTSK